MKNRYFFPLFLLSLRVLCAQTAPVPDFHPHPSKVWALTHGVLHPDPRQTIQDGTLLIRDGHIQAVGRAVDIPADATVLDVKGAHVYPGFIESWLELTPEEESSTKHTDHWNDQVRADRRAVDRFDPKAKAVTDLQKAGFTTAQVVLNTGIFTGSSGVCQLDATGTVLKPDLAQVIRFQYGGWSSKGYPNSLLGCIALIRQSLYDADWYDRAWTLYRKYPDRNSIPEVNESLAALERSVKQPAPFLFTTGDELAALRAGKIAREFSLNLWIKGSGYEYRRLKDLAAAAPLVIAPVNYPAKPDVADPYRALQYSTEQLKHWDLMPDNLLRMRQVGILFTLTSAGTSSPDVFRQNLIRSVERGLPVEDALSALTIVPAKAMGLEDQLGRLAPGLLANLVISDGDYFDSEATLLAVWIGGEEIPLKEPQPETLAGDWSLESPDFSATLHFSGTGASLTATLDLPDSTIALRNVHLDGDHLTWTLTLPEEGDSLYQFTGYVSDSTARGTYLTPTGRSATWTARQTAVKTPAIKEHTPEKASDLTVTYPEGVYGRDTEQPPQQTVLIDNATLWTCGPEGILTGWDMLVKDGKIAKIARDISVPRGKVTVIDGRGKYVTPGLIDAHSHSAAASINEGTQSVTAEVRIEDVLNSDDITIYRELAGGTTMANVLHGSANAIGGQNAVIKMRWGVPPAQLIYARAPAGIKFALGENVKQSNWGDNFTSRYPQTRMGVEEIIRDAFTAARDYERRWKVWKQNSRYRKTHIPPRRDLELDALVDILNRERMIHAHSYRQDEIEMLMRLTEEFGIRVGVFQHVLEGYKVADQIAAHGAGASTFSDWWAYKFEVIDAIPYNGALMHDVGVNVSFNSDSNELARRLNLEAAKAVKYGGLSETEALNLVTINPARQLGIDQWVGSLETGKDGDFVVWSGSPLSTYTVCEQTWIEGRQYYSLTAKEAAHQADQALRRQLIRKILNAEDRPGPKPTPDGDKDTHGYSCRIRDEIREGGVR
ncbi:MAG: amidohydrolase family protein [FCB group bacterium]|nr:amidohydrolase family protein [FCB group bacterium]